MRACQAHACCCSHTSCQLSCRHKPCTSTNSSRAATRLLQQQQQKPRTAATGEVAATNSSPSSSSSSQQSRVQPLLLLLLGGMRLLRQQQQQVPAAQTAAVYYRVPLLLCCRGTSHCTSPLANCSCSQQALQLPQQLVAPAVQACLSCRLICCSCSACLCGHLLLPSALHASQRYACSGAAATATIHPQAAAAAAVPLWCSGVGLSRCCRQTALL